MPNNPITDEQLAELDRWLDIANQPYHAKRKAAKTHAQYMVTQLVPALRQRLLDAESRLADARKENDFMRLRLAESDKACVYCDLPKAEMGRCASGFPGCARADDLFHCDELTRRDAQQRSEGAAEWLENKARTSKNDCMANEYRAEAARLRSEDAAKRREWGE